MSLPTWEKIENIFLTAADLPLGERKTFLDEACRGNEPLRREVESLLTSDSKNGEKIARAVEDEAEALFGLSPIVGSRLGAYQVIREIGRGGMGAVYLATRADDRFHKNVAIKVVKRGMDTTDVLRRFHHERQILAGLDHVYIARLIDAGTAPDGRPFFVMEYVEGEPIDSYCLSHALNLEDRCRLFLKVCEAVSHAHRNLVVHRDLKPGNIIVTKDGTPKLLDFGVAKLLAPEADPQLTVTGMQARLLTPQYASPEQVLGLPVNTATDVYSLGAIFYELLTGACAQNLDSTTPDEIQRVVCQTEVPLPSTVTESHGLSGASLRGDIDNIVMMAMRKDPGRRYRSVEQFAADIQRYLDGRPVLARKDSVSYRIGKFVGRHRLMIAAAVFVTASLVGGIVIANAQARRAERRLSQMVELANRSLFDVHSAIETLPGAMNARREIVKTTVSYLEDLSKDAGQDDNLRRSLATAYWRLADIQGFGGKPNLGDKQGALASYRKSAELLEPLRTRRANDPQVLMQATETYHHMGTVLDEIGDVPGMVKAYENALPDAQRLAKLVPDNVKACQNEGVLYNNLALALQFTEPDRARQYAEKHLAMLPALLAKFPGNDDLADTAAVAHATMATIYGRQGDRVRGLEEAKKSAEIREGVCARHPDDVLRLRHLMYAYGHVASEAGVPFVTNAEDPKTAREYFGKCVGIARRIVQADPGDNAARYDLGNALMRLGPAEDYRSDAARGVAELREAVDLLGGLASKDPATFYFQRPYNSALVDYGTALRLAGRLDEAMIQLRKSNEVAERNMKTHPGDTPTLSCLVHAEWQMTQALAAKHDLPGALEHAQRCLAVAQKYGRGPEQTIRNRYIGYGYFAIAFVDRAKADWPAAAGNAQLAEQWWDKGDKDQNPNSRQTAAAILAEASGHLKSK